MATLTVYGIKNCQSVKKALAYLSEAGVDFVFFDYKKQQLDKALFVLFLSQFKDKLINTKGTTYKALADAQKQALKSDDIGVLYDLICAYPSLLKRPIVHGVYKGKTLFLIGFDLVTYQAVFDQTHQ